MGGGVCLLMGALPGGGSKKKSIKGILKGLLIYYTYKLPLIRAVNVGICLFVVVRNVVVRKRGFLSNQNSRPIRMLYLKRSVSESVMQLSARY